MESFSWTIPGVEELVARPSQAPFENFLENSNQGQKTAGDQIGKQC